MALSSNILCCGVHLHWECKFVVSSEISVHQFGYEKTDLWISELNLETNLFWNVNGFIAVNVEVLTVVWQDFEKPKLTIHLLSVSLPSRILVSRVRKMSPDRTKSDAFHHFGFCEKESWKQSDMVNATYFISSVFKHIFSMKNITQVHWLLYTQQKTPTHSQQTVSFPPLWSITGCSLEFISVYVVDKPTTNGCIYIYIYIYIYCLWCNYAVCLLITLRTINGSVFTFPSQNVHKIWQSVNTKVSKVWSWYFPPPHHKQKCTCHLIILIT